LKTKEQIAEVIVAFDTYRQCIRRAKETKGEEFADDTDQTMAKVNEALLWVLEHPLGLADFERICQISIGRTKEIIGEELLSEGIQAVLKKAEE